MDKNKNTSSVVDALKMTNNVCPYFNLKTYIPSRKSAERLIYDIQNLFFPMVFPTPFTEEEMLFDTTELLSGIIKNESVALEFMLELPAIKRRLLNDASAIYEGDPAATSAEEIILAYPGFFSTFVHRIAHSLYLKKIPYLPRLMSEIAHEKTGIDIHPGAEIGERFCIDHGTGVVIGETARIGDRVKIYQGVTIGAKSFEIDENGKLKKGGKRHPDIGNNCIIYAGATILGGDTKIGDNCIIGGNVWLTHSLPPGSKIYYNEKGLLHLGIIERKGRGT